MGFYVTTENPNVMMTENHRSNTQSSEYIIICQDGLYIVSTTPEVLKIPVLDSSRSPALRGSSTLLGSPVIFS